MYWRSAPVRGLVTRMRVIDEPDFAAETSALLERMSGGPGLSDVEALLAVRSRTADPAVAGRPDPAATSADLYLPARGGPVPARLYARRGLVTRAALPWPARSCAIPSWTSARTPSRPGSMTESS